MSDFPIQPYTGAQYIYGGFQNAAELIAHERQRQMQMAQFQSQQAMEQKRLDLGYYTADATNARDYYGLDLRKQEMQDNIDSREKMRADSLTEKAREEQDKYDPKRIQPVQLMDPTTGKPMPGVFGVPMTGQIVPAPKPVAPAMGTDPTGSGNFYFDGHSLKPAPGATKLPASAVSLVTAELSSMATTNATMAANQQEIAQHQAAIAGGDHRFGMLNLWSRANRIAELQQQNQGLAGQVTASEAKIAQIKANLGGAGQGGNPAGVQASGQKPVKTPVPLVTPLPAGPEAAGTSNNPLPLFPGATPGAAAPLPATPLPATPGPTAGQIGQFTDTALPGATPGPKLDPATAHKFLQQARGDNVLARQLARQAGYSF